MLQHFSTFELVTYKKKDSKVNLCLSFKFEKQPAKRVDRQMKQLEHVTNSRYLWSNCDVELQRVSNLFTDSEAILVVELHGLLSLQALATGSFG